MPRTPEEIDELKAKLTLARKKPVNFGLCLGRGGDGTVLLLHRRKPPDLLARRAKKKGETQKTASGHLQLKSRTVIMTCLDSPPPMMARQMRLYLREFDLLFKVDIIEPGGDTIETEGSDDGTDPAPLLEPTAPKVVEQREKWQEIEIILDKAVAQTIAAGDPKSDTITAAWDKAKDAADSGKYKTALKVAKKIRPHLVTEKATKSENSSNDPDEEKWAKIEKKLETQLAAARALHPANSDKLKQAFDAFGQTVQKGDYKSAGLVAKKLGPALDKVLADGPPDLSSFDMAHDALTERLRQVGLAFPTTKLAKRLRAVRLDVERPPHDLPKALAETAEIDAALTATAKTWFAGIKDETNKALATIGKYHGVAEQHARLCARQAGIDDAFHSTPPEYDEIDATHAAILADRAALKRISDRYAADYKEWIGKKKNWCDIPLAKLKDPALSSEKSRISGVLTQAQVLLDNNNLSQAKRLITAAYWDIKTAEEMVADKAAFATLLKTTTSAVDSLAKLETADLAPEITALKQDISSASLRAKAQDFYTARIILDPIPARVSALKDDLGRRADPEYLNSLTKRAGKLANSMLNRQIEEQLSQASSLSLRKAEFLITAAETAAGKQPGKDQLRALECGSEIFDELLKSVPEDATTDLLLARYVAAPGKSGASRGILNLQSLHDAVKGTGRLEFSEFRPVKRKKDKNHTTSPGPMIRERISDDVITTAYNPFSDKAETRKPADHLGNVDTNCEPNGEIEKIAYGHWNAFHQIGQVINTRKKFMQTNGKKKVFGSWQDHGSDVSIVARSVAQHFGVERVFVERAIRGKTDIPPPPEYLEPDPWNKAHTATLNWVSEARCSAALWNSEDRSAAHRIDGRVIHEAGKDHWVSYDYSARSKGVSGRQFRSPGDWFAELYAAYQTNVMNPAHPARDWLTKL